MGLCDLHSDSQCITVPAVDAGHCAPHLEKCRGAAAGEESSLVLCTGSGQGPCRKAAFSHLKNAHLNKSISV